MRLEVRILFKVISFFFTQITAATYEYMKFYENFDFNKIRNWLLKTAPAKTSIVDIAKQLNLFEQLSHDDCYYHIHNGVNGVPPCAAIEPENIKGVLAGINKNVANCVCWIYTKEPATVEKELNLATKALAPENVCKTQYSHHVFNLFDNLESEKQNDSTMYDFKTPDIKLFGDEEPKNVLDQTAIMINFIREPPIPQSAVEPKFGLLLTNIMKSRGFAAVRTDPKQ